MSENEYLETRLKEFLEFSRIIEDKGVICYNISLPQGLVLEVIEII